jgi:serine/threonine protein kinase
LECLHEQGVIYRDLKPENVLLFANGYAKLSDFGLAKQLSEPEQKAKTQAGTLIYSAPEMALKVGYNKSVDFWTLGVFIYELATC